MRYLLFSFILIVSFVHANVDDTAAEVSDTTRSEESADTFADEFASEFDKEFNEEDKAVEALYDPLSGYNRWMTGVNDSLMIYVMEPVADGYRSAVPEQGRESVYHFMNNLYFPVSFVNNLLQFKIAHAGTESLRFMLNSTVGVLGLFDVADSWFGIKPHVEDFGQTLGYYGVGSGIPVVLPFFGPRNLRDLTGTFVDGYTDPVYYYDSRFYNTVEPFWDSVLVKGYDEFNEYSLQPSGSYQKFTEDAIDLYPFLRDAYEQYRNKLITE